MKLTHEEFKRLSREWHRATDGASSVHRKIAHPAYLAILAAGPEVIPFILEELQGCGGHWFMALAELSGEQPVIFPQRPYTLELWPTMEEITNKWLAWGRENGKLP